MTNIIWNKNKSIHSASNFLKSVVSQVYFNTQKFCAQQASVDMLGPLSLTPPLIHGNDIGWCYFLLFVNHYWRGISQEIYLTIYRTFSNITFYTSYLILIVSCLIVCIQTETIWHKKQFWEYICNTNKRDCQLNEGLCLVKWWEFD